MFVCLFVYYYIEEYENIKESIITRDLEKDGFCVLHNHLYSKNTVDYPCKTLENDILNILPSDYVFIDYIYKINNTALSTFHRDVTSSKHLYNTKFPVYTLILYKYDGELLSVCPGSNKSYPFVFSKIVNIDGEDGTVFLFDCDLLHAGRVNNCKDKEVIQYKICHKDDLPLLNHLDKVNIEKNETCENTLYRKIIRKMTYFFEMPINYFFYPLMVKREESNTLIGFIQLFIPISYYNNY